MDVSEVIFGVIKYLNCVFEIFLLYYFLEAGFQVYEERRSVRFLKTVICVTVMFIINSFGIPLVNLISVPFICMFFVWLIFRLELKYAFLYVLIYFVITAVTEFAFHYIYKLLGVDITTVSFGRVLILVIQNVFRFMIIQIIKKQHYGFYPKGGYQYLKTLFILPITSLILLNGFFVPANHPAGYFLICIGGILLIVSNVAYFFVVARMLKAVNAAKDAELLMMKIRLEQRHYQRLEEINQDHARYIHEMKRVVRTMEHLAYTKEDAKVKELADELISKGYPEKRKVFIGDQILNAIFIEREKMAEDMRIRYQAEIQPGIDVGFIDDMDKITMLGNLLDNALEAAASSDEGFVNVDLYMGNEALVIFRVENNFKIKPRKKGHKYLTNKYMKKDHGFGIEIVEDLSKKYKGILSIIENESTFITMLILSNMSKMEV